MEMNMTTTTKSTIEATEFPAYKIYRPFVGRKFKDGDQIAVPYESRHYGTMFDFFTLGTVIGYAVRNGDDPIECLKRATENGHKLYWANKNSVCLHNGPRVQIEVPGFNVGDTIHLQGKTFRLDRAPNQNIELVEID
jgi:hypothetical protein